MHYRLYQPSSKEVWEITNHRISKYPHLAKPLRKAGKILADFRLEFYPKISMKKRGWQILSQTVPEFSYENDGKSCGCPSFEAGDYQIAGSKFCKHKFAYRLYQIILLDHCRTMLRNGRLVILGPNDTEALSASTIMDMGIAGPMPIVHTPTKHGFLTPTDMAEWSQWLDKELNPDDDDNAQEALYVYLAERARGASIEAATAAADGYWR
jgi:hypothetical protein